jgi:hypothetical protein
MIECNKKNSRKGVNEMKKGILLLVLMAFIVWGTILPVSAQEKAKPEFTMVRLVVGTGVDNREPVGVAETFPETTEKIYCFLEATDIAKDTEVSMIWFHGEEEMLKTSLPLNMGPRWRTYAYKNLRGLKGDWKVELRDANGNLLKDIKFKVE